MPARRNVSTYLQPCQPNKLALFSPFFDCVLIGFYDLSLIGSIKDFAFSSPSKYSTILRANSNDVPGP
ncbi:hypothetical protein BpHYR1_050467 [Brachionus plicatilis]|uniref:Uncharacterized protein n=1 Tax=Brachionus plicatilis TaxID=10195 RepID=A0A3M7P1K4_BRAPC|nr:hypothetical protein BpHYR1_050467 [Brachionus plicatilis]